MTLGRAGDMAVFLAMCLYINTLLNKSGYHGMIQWVSNYNRYVTHKTPLLILTSRNMDIVLGSATPKGLCFLTLTEKRIP